MPLLLRLGAVLGRVLAWLILLLATLWGSAALWIDGPSPPWVAGLLAVAFALACLSLLLRVKHLRRGMLLMLVPLAAVLTWWLSIPASNQRDWLPDVARLPYAEINGSQLTLHNIRNFEYRGSDTDFVEHWDTQSYDLDKLIGLDLFISYWGPTLYAHTIMSWEFADGRHLAISIETRKEKGEDYSAVLGFFRQYELYYVVASERDVIGVRTNHRGERVYLYRLKARPEGARALLLQYLQEVNSLARSPAWYNALTTNCTTAIWHHIKALAPQNPWDWRILVNGYLDEMTYERRNVDTTLPFPELRKRSDITDKAKAADASPDFSQLIRAGLPGAR